MEYFNLTTPQKNIWNLQKFYDDTAIANLCGVVFFENVSDIELLKKAVNRVIEIQSALRLQFVYKSGEVKQYVKEYAYVDISTREFQSEEAFEQYAKQCASKPIGLSELRMYHFEIISIGDKVGVFALLSHLVSDAWTFSLLINEIHAEYKALLYGNEKAAKSTNYIEYVKKEQEYFSSSRFEKDKQYWEEKYIEKPENSPIKVYTRTKDSIVAKRIERKLSSDLTMEIKSYCQSSNVSEAVLFETALYCYLYKINSDHKIITIGLPVLNRVKAYEKDMAGMFISTVPLTIELSDEDTLKTIAEKITKEHRNSFRHQKYPYSMILESLREKQNFEGNLYDVMFSFQNAQSDVDSYTKWYCNGYSEVPFTLHVDNRDNNDTYTLTIDYQVEVFKDEKEIEDIVNRFKYVLEQIIKNDNTTVDGLLILPDSEKQRILYEFNDTAVDYPKDKCVHELFMEQAKNTPDAVAVVFEEKEITYRELDEMSNALAHLLCKKGVKRGDIIPIIAKRSWHIIVAMLSILKAGAGYMPVSPDYPKDRVQFIIEEAKSRIGCVLGYEEQLEDIELIKLDEVDFEDCQPEWKEALENQNQAGDICYVIFTSGSTGVPKGVMITHGNLHNFIGVSQKSIYQNEFRNITKSVLATTDLIFDISVFEIFMSLLHGVSLIISNDTEILSGREMGKLIEKHDINSIHITPTKLKYYMRDEEFINSLTKIRIIMIGAEIFTKELWGKLNKSTFALIYNGYGPTETTIGVLFKKINNSDITIGHPIANTQIYILDKQSNPVPIGVPGELCIAGDGVGLGYLNRPDLTAERFVPNPFATEENGHGKIMYHTGDLAAWREDGEIEYLGRIDTQVKIRGLRIELGEIESLMAEFPGIQMCAVTDKKDEEGRQFLAGYYTTASDEKESQNIMTAVKVDEKELRKYLSSKLPKYMVPNYFIHIAKIPMTPSGKTDRKNLPMPEMLDNILQEYREPVTEQERILCRLMEEILGYAPVGIEHDFFYCGGDSLKAMEFIVKAEEKGIRIQLQDIFEHPTVEQLTEYLAKSNKKLPEISEEYTMERFEKYQPLLERNKTAAYYDIQEISITSVLLSGITGFLGAHIAEALLQNTDCVIYCLVRSKESEEGIKRTTEVLEYYFGNQYVDMIGTRIIPISGDITNKRLSEGLPKKVDMVIHAAATVKHYGSYEYFDQVNTLGTKNMAEYAFRIGARFIHISTLSVSGNAFADSFDTEIALEERCFGEDCLYQGQALTNVYVRSKFEAECAVLDAMLQGLQANIIRVGNLTNRSSDYVFQPNFTENAFLSRIRAALELGYLPDYMMPLYSEFSPVDDTADAIVRIARHFSTKHSIFHVYSNQNLYFDRMVEILKELSIAMQVVDGETFAQLLKETVSQNREHIYKAFLNDMDENGKLNYDSNIHIQNEFTISYLKQLGFEWTKIDYEYIKGYLEYFQKIHYFE